MARMLGNNKTAFDSAKSQFWVVDANVSSIISENSRNFQIVSCAFIFQGLYVVFNITA